MSLYSARSSEPEYIRKRVGGSRLEKVTRVKEGECRCGQCDLFSCEGRPKKKKAAVHLCQGDDES